MNNLQQALDGPDVPPSKPPTRRAIKELQKRARFLLELSIIRAVDNFLNYVTDLLLLVFERRPEILKAGTERLDFVLSFKTMEELQIALAEKKLQSLSYKNLRDLAKDLEPHVSLFESEAVTSRAALLIEQRNLLVHSRGIVNKIYLNRTGGSSSLCAGDTIPLSSEQVMDDIAFLNEIAGKLDAGAVDKFKLATTVLPKDIIALLKVATHYNAPERGTESS